VSSVVLAGLHVSRGQGAEGLGIMGGQTSPVVSVIIPTYQSAETLPRALDSVLRQEFQDFEIIVVDDGSTDDTRAVVEGVMAADSRVRYLYQENQGPAVARNKGVANASAELIAFLDADDEWYPHKLQEQVEILRENPHIDFVISDSLSINAVNNQSIAYSSLHAHVIQNLKMKRVQESNDVYIILNGQLRQTIYERNFINTSTVVMRKGVFREAGGFDPTWRGPEDKDFWIRLPLSNAVFAYWDNVSVVRHHYTSSLTWPGERTLLELIRFHSAYLASPEDQDLHPMAHRLLMRSYRGLVHFYGRNRAPLEAVKVFKQSLAFGFDPKLALYVIAAFFGPAPFAIWGEVSKLWPPTRRL
jgi:glycosyltransferase involved in cell wall biosynthesis